MSLRGQRLYGPETDESKSHHLAVPPGNLTRLLIPPPGTVRTGPLGLRVDRVDRVEAHGRHR